MIRSKALCRESSLPNDEMRSGARENNVRHLVRHGKCECSTSELGHERRCWSRLAMSAIPSIATIEADMPHFAFGPKADSCAAT